MGVVDVLLKIFKDPNDRKIKKIMPIIDHINHLEPEFAALTDEQLNVMKRFGDKRRAPHQYIWAENRAAELWRRAMETLNAAAIERGWIE